MSGATGKTRNLPALALALALAAAGELPHSHSGADSASDAALAPPLPTRVELRNPGSTSAAGESVCPACVLQRLLRQANGPAAAALQEPGTAGTVIIERGSAAPQSFVDSARPRGPPSQG